VKLTNDDAVDTTANQTVRLDLGTKDGVKSMRIGFTDQRLTAHGGLVAWTRFIAEVGLREQLRAVVPHTPTSNNAYDPCDTALGFMGGILCGADKLARVAHLAHDPAVAEVLGIEAVPSQSTLSRFFAECGRGACEAISGLHAWSLRSLPARSEGYTLDLDSFSLVHEDGHQQGVRVGYTRKGLKPCHRPIVAALAEVPLIAHFWLRPGNTACVSGAQEFLGDTLARLPAPVRIGLVRADSGFCTQRMLGELERRQLSYIMTAALRAPVRTLCRHDDSAWTPTEVPGLAVQEVAHEGARLIVVRQKVAERPHAGGKQLIEVPGYKFQALRTNLPARVSALEVWRRYNGRADIENRIKELGAQFGLKGLCLRSFWATEAACHLAICAYNLCVGLQRRLGQTQRAELSTLRWRLFSCAAVFSHTGGKPTLKLAVRSEKHRRWWRVLLRQLSREADCDAVAALAARAGENHVFSTSTA
jgi:Transposase DDE domain group 1